MRSQGPVVAGHDEAEKVRGTNDPIGEPIPTSIAGGNSLSTVRGARARSGSHRHLSRRSHRGRIQPNVSEARDGQQMGQNPGGRQFLVLRKFEILFARRIQMLLTRVMRCTVIH